jgi:hypothetical protein
MSKSSPASFSRRPVLGLLDAGGGQFDIGPAGEAVFKVPGGFTMADEHELVHEALSARALG